MTEIAPNREVARTALEQVCARGDMALAPSCYAEDFADYVGSLVARIVDPIAPNLAALRRVSSNVERA